MENKTPKQIRNTLLGSKVVKALENRHFEAYYCETSVEALSKAIEIIPEGSSVSWGGTVTVREMGLGEALNRGNYKAFDRDKATNPTESAEIMHKALSLDYYVTGTNAISEDGVLVNVDKNGNRVAAICYGPKNVLVIIGINKIVPTEEEAIIRARKHAAPINQMRFMGNTPCSTTGSCGNCKSVDSICCQILSTRLSSPPKRIKVIIVGEELGF